MNARSMAMWTSRSTWCGRAMIISRARRAFLRLSMRSTVFQSVCASSSSLGVCVGGHDARPGHADLAAVVEHLAVVAQLLRALVGGGVGDGVVGCGTARRGGRRLRRGRSCP